MAADRVELTPEQLAALTPASQGTPITGATMPAGGAGLAGWLSALKTALYDVWDSAGHLLKTKADQGARGAAAWIVGGTTFTLTADIVRPANATPYAAYDIIAAQASGTNVIFMEFDTGKIDSSGYITKARLETDRTAESGQYRLLLFRVPETGLTTRLTSLGDNDLYPMKFANKAHRIGHIDFTTWTTGGTNSDAASSLRDDIRLKYGLASGVSKLYGLLINLTAQTPQSAQAFSPFLSFESNT